MKGRCDQCEAWNPYLVGPAPEEGGCHRRAPAPSDGKEYAYWRTTRCDDWCCEFEQKSEKRHLIICTHTHDDEERALADLVMRFAETMLTKLLAKKRVHGFSGWRDTSDSGLAEKLWEGMADHIGKWRQKPNRLDQLVDVANYCAFIWNLPQEKAR